MSFREWEKIEGKLKLVDIRKLRDTLVPIYTEEIEEKFKGNKIVKRYFSKISKGMTDFAILHVSECSDTTDLTPPDVWDIAWLKLNMKTGEISGEIHEGNYAVSNVYENSATWNALVRFLNDLQETKTGTTYGACITYNDENIEAEMLPPHSTYYGDWRPK